MANCTDYDTWDDSLVLHEFIATRGLVELHDFLKRAGHGSLSAPAENAYNKLTEHLKNLSEVINKRNLEVPERQ